MKAHVLLLRPPGKQTDCRLFAMEQLGLSYIAAVARADGLSVEIVDGFLDANRYERILCETKDGDYYVIGYPIYQETVRRVSKDVSRLRDRGLKTHVTVGNYLATLSPEPILRAFPQFDSAIRGEGEYTLSELARAIASNQGLEQILGLSYRDGFRIRHNASRPNEQDLDTIPFPARDTLALVLAAGNAPLIYSSRGCNARCEFCSVHKFYRSSPNGAWRARSATNVVDEMEQLAKNFGVGEFAFADEQFMGHGQAGIDRALGIAREIRSRNLKFKWYIETRSADVSVPVFRELRDAGLAAVFMGFESGYDPALKALRKGIKVSQHLNAISILRDLEILPSVGFIMFRPETTLEELEHNVDFLEEIGCGEITSLSTQLRVYSGTDLEASLLSKQRARCTSAGYVWDFVDPRVSECYRFAIESTEVLSVSYNAFARLRRLGCLTYEECLELQRVMNSGPISVFRELLRVARSQNCIPDEVARELEAKSKRGCEDFLRLLKFTEIVTRNRHLTTSAKLLNPMALC